MELLMPELLSRGTPLLHQRLLPALVIPRALMFIPSLMEPALMVP